MTIREKIDKDGVIILGAIIIFIVGVTSGCYLTSTLKNGIYFLLLGLLPFYAWSLFIPGIADFISERRTLNPNGWLMAFKASLDDWH